jgi:DNA-binding CsgD family transcriptional regulator
MAFDGNISDAVGLLYDCVADDDTWPDALDRVCTMADGFLISLGVLDIATRTAGFAAASGDRALLAQMAVYAHTFPFYHIMPRMELDTPLAMKEIIELHGHGGQQLWSDSAYYREFAVPNGLECGIALAVTKQPGRVGCLNIAVRKGRRPVDDADLQLVSLLAPHIRRAVAIGELFDMEKRKAEIFGSLLDALSHAVLIVSSDMRILYANSAAESTLDEGIAVRSVRGRFAATYMPANAALIQAVEQGSRDEALLSTAGINVPLGQIEAPMVAHVLPLSRRVVSAHVSSRAAAAIFLAAPGTQIISAIEAFAALFGLTAGEKRTAALIAKGMSRANIAIANGVSDSTIKSQLGMIFDKTHTQDQRGLQQLISELTPQVKLSLI